jgi:hypothetical protein
LIIDEGFGCMDNEHLHNTKEFMMNLNHEHKYGWIIVISHIEELQNITKNRLYIEMKDNKSKLLLGEIPEIPVPSVDASEKMDENVVIYDDNDKLYCNICEKNVRGVESHIKTNIHMDNVRKRDKKKETDLDIDDL